MRDAGEQREKEREETFDACRFFSLSLFFQSCQRRFRRVEQRLVFLAPSLAVQPCLLPR